MQATPAGLVSVKPIVGTLRGLVTPPITRMRPA